jgi:outer membrane protein assembly factor BamA
LWDTSTSMFIFLQEGQVVTRIQVSSVLAETKGHPSMRHSRFGIYVTAVVFFSLIVQSAARASDAPIVRTAIRAIGSVPPDDSLFFPCTRELNGKPYSDASVKSCLLTIEKLPFVQHAKVDKSRLEDETGRMLVVFEVSAKPLPIREMTFDCPPEDKSPLEKWLKVSPDTLRLGAAFSRDEYSVTYQAIESFYRNRGRLVGIVPTVDLRFREGTAGVSFKIVLGPQVRLEPQLPPHGPPCSDHIVAHDWSGTDKHVPFALVFSTVSLSAPLACYSVEAAQRDQAALDKLGILESSLVEYRGEPGSRVISYRLKGKPITLADVSIQPFGPANCLETARQSLKLKAGETYLRQDADQSARNVEKACSRPGAWTEVTETDNLTADRRLQVVFNVLTFPQQTVLVDGAAVDSAQLAAFSARPIGAP